VSIEDLKRRATDCPKCPHCGVSCGVPMRAADWNHRAQPTDRIVCPACGMGWFGTDAEFQQSELAQQAWGMLQEIESGLS
jgi:hypothetical protein